MTTPWLPTDDELDGLARTLDVPELSVEAAEQHRTRLLASAATAGQLPRHSRIPLIVGVGGGLAAAAALLLWVGLRPSEPGATARADIVAIGDASFVRERGWPTYAVRLDHGRVSVDVMTVDDAQTFVATTSDAQIVVRASKFIAGAEATRLTWVDVRAGIVELRHAGATIILSAGQTWQPPFIQTAEAVVVPSGPTTTTTAKPADEAPTVPKHPPSTRRKSNPSRVEAGRATRDEAPATPATSTTSADARVPTPTPTAPAVIAPRPGELEFRAGVAALRRGDAAGATKSFDAACAAARNDALGEDACFWVGAAANRAGQAAAARDALGRFLQQFPRSARAGEASALLGWLLYDAGDLDRAEARFKVAAADSVPKVRESAERGLEAIKRKRATTSPSR